MKIEAKKKSNAEQKEVAKANEGKDQLVQQMPDHLKRIHAWGMIQDGGRRRG